MQPPSRVNPLTRRIDAALGLGNLDVDAVMMLEVRRIGFVPAWFQVVAVVALFVATVFLTNAEHRAKGTTFGFPGPAFNALINPIYEELIFRGLILGALARRCSATASIVVSSLLFGILHLRNIFWLDASALAWSMLYTGAILSPILGWVSLRCRSAWPAVVFHYLNNLVYFVRH